MSNPTPSEGGGAPLASSTCITFGSEWRPLSRLPSRRQYYAVAAIAGLGDAGDRLALVGGHDPTTKSFLDSIAIFDTRRNEWIHYKMKEKRRFCSAVAVDQRIYVFGGYNDTDRVLNSCELLDLASLTPESVLLPPLKERRQGCSAVTILNNKFIVVMGGNDGQNALGSMEILDVSTLQWTNQKLPQLGEKRFYLGAASSGPYVMVAGGYGHDGHHGGSSQGKLSSCEILDMRNKRWQRGWKRLPADLQRPRYHCGACAVAASATGSAPTGGAGDKSFVLVVAGGVGTKSVEAYDSKSKTWRELPSLLEMSCHRQVAVMPGLSTGSGNFLIAAGETSLEWLPRTDTSRRGIPPGIANQQQQQQQQVPQGASSSSSSSSLQQQQLLLQQQQRQMRGGGAGGPVVQQQQQQPQPSSSRTSYVVQAQPVEDNKEDDDLPVVTASPDDNPMTQEEQKAAQEEEEEQLYRARQALEPQVTSRSSSSNNAVDPAVQQQQQHESSTVSTGRTTGSSTANVNVNDTATEGGGSGGSARSGASTMTGSQSADATHVAVTQWNDVQFGSVWKLLTKLPNRRQYYALAAIGNDRVAVVGGHDPTSKQYLDSVDVYNTQTQTWTSYKMRIKRRFCAAVAIDTRVFVFGGHNDTHRHLNSCEVIDTAADPNSGSQPLQPMKYKRQGCAAVAVYDNRYIIVMGGNDGKSVLSTVEIFDVRSLNWKRQQLPSMLEKRFYLAAASSGPFILVAGGYGRGRLSSAEILDVRTGHWQKGWERFADMQIARYHCGGAAISLANKSFTMVVAGGVGTKSVEAYDSKTQTWFPLPAMQDLSCHRQLELLGEQLVAAGESSLESLDLAVTGTRSVVGPSEIAASAAKDEAAAANNEVVVEAQPVHEGQPSNPLPTVTVAADPANTTSPSSSDQGESGPTATAVSNRSTGEPEVVAAKPQREKELMDASMPRDITTTSSVVDSGMAASTARSQRGPSAVTTPEFGAEWRTIARLGNRRQYYALAAVGDDSVAVVGGHDLNSRQHLDTVDVWDMRKNSWTSFQMTERRRFCAAVAIGTRVFTFGGHNNTNRHLNSAEVVDVADPNARSQPLPPMRSKRQGCAAVAVYENRYIVVLGGNDGKNVLSSVEIFDVQKMQWRKQQLPPMLDKRYYLAGATAGPYILVVGGFGSARLSSTEMLDMRSGEWKNGWKHFASMRMERYHCGSVAVASSGESFVLVVAGGVGTKSAEAYDSTTNSWFALPEMIAPSSHRQLIKVGSLLVAGGEASIEGLSFSAGKARRTTEAVPSTEPVTKNLPVPSSTERSANTGHTTSSTSTSGEVASAAPATKSNLTESSTSGAEADVSSSETRGDQGKNPVLVPMERTQQAPATNVELTDKTQSHMSALTPPSSSSVDNPSTASSSGTVPAPSAAPPAAATAAAAPPPTTVTAEGGGGGGTRISFGQEWMSLTSLQSRRQYYAFANIGLDRLAIIGGHDPASKAYLNTVDVYDIRRQTWTSYEMRERRRFCAAVAVGNRIFVFGGHNGTSRHLASAEMIDLDDPSSGSLELAPMKHKRQGCAAVAVYDNRYIVVLGGNDGKNVLSSVEIFDVRTLRWRTQQLPSMLEKRYYLAAAAAGPYILVAGGFGSGRLSSAELLNTRMSPGQGRTGWRKFCNMKLARYHCGGVALAMSNDALTMVVAGGVGTKSVEAYDSTSDSWSSLPALQVTSCHRHLALLGDRLVAAGESSLEFLELTVVRPDATGSASQPSITAQPPAQSPSAAVEPSSATATVPPTKATSSAPVLQPKEAVATSSVVDEPGRTDQTGRTEHPSQVENPAPRDQAGRVEKPAVAVVEQPTRAEKPALVDQPTRAEKPMRVEKPALVDQPTQRDQPMRVEKPAPVDQPTQRDQPMRVEKPAPVEKPTQRDQPMRVEKPALVDQPTQRDHPTRVEKPAPVEKPTQRDQPMRVEKPAPVEQPTFLAPAPEPPSEKADPTEAVVQPRSVPQVTTAGPAVTTTAFSGAEEPTGADDSDTGTRSTIRFGDAWRPLAMLPGRRQYYGLAALGTDRVAVVGGFDHPTKTYLDTIDLWDMLNESWSSFKMLEKRRFCAAVAIGNRVFIFGGHNPTHRYLSSCEMIDLSGTTPESKALPPMKHNRQGCAAVAVDGSKYIVVFGGNDGKNVLSSVEIFDVDRLRWREPGPPMLEKRYYLAGATAGPFIVAAGGFGNGRLSSTEKLEMRSGEWQKGWEKFEQMQLARYHCGGAAIASSDDSFTMVVAGGVGTKSCEAYDSLTNSWVDLPSLRSTSSHRQLALLGSELVAAGEHGLESLNLVIERSGEKYPITATPSRQNQASVAASQEHGTSTSTPAAAATTGDGSSTTPESDGRSQFQNVASASETTGIKSGEADVDAPLPSTSCTATSVEETAPEESDEGSQMQSLVGTVDSSQETVVTGSNANSTMPRVDESVSPSVESEAISEGCTQFRETLGDEPTPASQTEAGQEGTKVASRSRTEPALERSAVNAADVHATSSVTETKEVTKTSGQQKANVEADKKTDSGETKKIEESTITAIDGGASLATAEAALSGSMEELQVAAPTMETIVPEDLVELKGSTAVMQRTSVASQTKARRSEPTSTKGTQIERVSESKQEDSTVAEETAQKQLQTPMYNEFNMPLEVRKQISGLEELIVELQMKVIELEQRGPVQVSAAMRETAGRSTFKTFAAPPVAERQFSSSRPYQAVQVDESQIAAWRTSHYYAVHPWSGPEFAPVIIGQDRSISLFVAIYYGNMRDFEEVFADNPNVNVNVLDSLGRSPVDFAAIMGEMEMMNYLIAKGGKCFIDNKPSLRALARERAREKCDECGGCARASFLFRSMVMENFTT